MAIHHLYRTVVQRSRRAWCKLDVPVGPHLEQDNVIIHTHARQCFPKKEKHLRSHSIAHAFRNNRCQCPYYCQTHKSFRDELSGRSSSGRVQCPICRSGTWYCPRSLDIIHLILTTAVPVHVHISNLAAQSGASLFLHTHAPPYTSALRTPSESFSTTWVYNKTESLSPQTLMSSLDVTHLIAEEPCPIPLNGWHKVQGIPGFRQWKIDMDIIKTRSWGRMNQVLSMVTGDELCILERESTLP